MSRRRRRPARPRYPALEFVAGAYKFFGWVLLFVVVFGSLSLGAWVANRLGVSDGFGGLLVLVLTVFPLLAVVLGLFAAADLFYLLVDVASDLAALRDTMDTASEDLDTIAIQTSRTADDMRRLLGRAKK